jgi:hypothetical protein
VRHLANAAEQTHGRVNWVPDVSAWPAGHQASFGRVNGHMKAASTVS